MIAILFLSCKDNTNKVINSAPETVVELAATEKVKTVMNSELETTLENSSLNPENSISDSGVLRTVLYKGTLDSTINIQLYLNEQESPCGGDITMLSAMYKYDNQNKWILLEVTRDRQKKFFCMVEDNFSGVLFLKESENDFSGQWISPDTNKQLKIELKKIDVDNTTIEKLDEILFDDLIYNKYDC